jgi:hypothetical protein
MATATLRPNATPYNQGWTVVGASAHGAVDDDPTDDATYVQAAAGGWLLVYDLGPLTLPAYAQIRSVSVRVRRRGNSSAVLDVATGYQPRTGSYQRVVLSSGEKPTSTIATKTYGSLVAAPGGAAWDNNTVVPNLQVSLGANDTNIRVYEVYADVVYDTAPTCVVTAPLGEVVGTQVPVVEFSYTDTEGSALERAHAKVFTAAQHAASGFGPDTAAAFWDSGEVLTNAQSLTVGTPLPDGDYHVYVRAADAGSGGRFGPWASAEFTMGGQLPAAPTLSGAADSTYRRNVLTVTQRDNLLSYGQSTSGTGSGDGWYPDDNTTLDSISPTAPTATTLSETFTGANGALSAANTDVNWTVVRGSFAVASNQLTSADSELILPSAIRADGTLPSVDHFAQVVVNTLSTSVDRSVHLVLRMAGSGYAGIVVELNQKFNRFAVWEALTATTGRAVSGFRSLPKALALPATWRAEVSGSTVSVYVQMANDSAVQLLGQWTTSILTGTQVGLGLYNAGSTSLVDSFTAGDLAPVVGGASGASGAGLLEVTAVAARQARVISGGRYGWVTPVTGGEQLTVLASAWQTADAARQARVDVEYFGADEDPLVDAVFTEGWAGANGSAWDTGSWTPDHGTGATDTVQNGAGVLTTGAIAYLSPARMYGSGTTALADCEALVKIVPASTTAETRGTVGLRTDGTWSLGYPAVGYFVELDPQNDVVLVRRGSGSAVLNGSGTAYTVPAIGTYVRLRCHGTTVAAKWWDSDRQEPAVWGFVTEDATHSAAGRVSVTAQNGGDAVVRAWTFSGLTVDSLSYHSFGALFTTATDGELTESRRNVVVPAGATGAKTVLVSFPTGAGESFVWDKIGLVPGADRDWSRGGLCVANLYDSDESAFESSGTSGWTASTDAAVVRATDYPASPAGTALELAWSATSGLPGAVYAYGPAKHAVAGDDYAVRAWLWRIAADVSDLQLGVQFLDSSDGPLAQSFAASVLPEVDRQFLTSAHTMRAPAGTAKVRAVLACSPVQAGAAAITRVHLVRGGVAPAAYQPGPAADGYALAEYSDDGGQSWERVRGTAEAAYPSGHPRTVTVYDHEAPPGAARTYRASTAAVDYYLDADGAATVVSEPSAELSLTLPASEFWLKDPLVPARTLLLTIGGDLEHSSREPQESHDTLGRPNAVVVSDVVKGEEFTLPLVFKTAESYRQFEELRAAGNPLLFQSDFGEQWYVKVGPERRTVVKNSIVRLSTPLRLVDVSAVEVDRPDPDESNADVVTSSVWETV